MQIVLRPRLATSLAVRASSKIFISALTKVGGVLIDEKNENSIIFH